VIDLITYVTNFDEFFYYVRFQATPISFSSGKLLGDRSTWLGNDNTPATVDQRRQVNIVSPDIPTRYIKSVSPI
jgi:hypothetical protein